METIKNVLFPTDFSEAAENALPYAADIATKTGARLSLLHIYNETHCNVCPDGDSPHVQDASSRDKALRKLKQIIAGNHLSSLQYRCLVYPGETPKHIVEVAGRCHSDLIVMGTQGGAGRGPLRQSITNTILPQAPCPVLTVPLTARFSGISKIVYATDLQGDEMSMIHYVIELAEYYNARVTILHADRSGTTFSGSIGALKRIVDSIAYPLVSLSQVVGENAMKGIDRYIDENKPDLIAMTSFNIPATDQVSYQSLTRQMFAHIRTPLLVFTHKKYNTIFLG